MSTMEVLTYVFLGFIILSIIVGFIILILVVVLRKDNSSTPSQQPSSTTDQSNPVVSQIAWTEKNRGFPATYFPPCCESSNEIKKIFSLISGYNLQKKYMQLFDIYSIVMCQDTQIRMKVCSDTFINDRIADLNTYGADPTNTAAIAIVKSTTNLSNNKIGKFLLMATDLIEKQMNNIKNDNAISNTDKEQIYGYNSQFYNQKYDYMAKHCP